MTGKVSFKFECADSETMRSVEVALSKCVGAFVNGLDKSDEVPIHSRKIVLEPIAIEGELFVDGNGDDS